MRKYMSLLLIVIFLLGTLSGCSTEHPIVHTGSVQPSAPGSQSTSQRVITDMAGRAVTLPERIDSVFSAGPVSAIYLYTLVPDLLLGWNYELNEIEKSIILEKYHTLPNFGQKDAINYEAVIAAAPSIALNVGTINDKLISDCDAMSRRLGIPVVAVDGDLLAAPDAYRFLGTLFGVEEEAERLAAYTEKTFQDISAMNIPEAELVRVYYGNGEDSLETAPEGSSHAQILDLVRAVNVAELELGDGSRVRISAEQLLAWDPDVILVIGEAKAGLSGSAAAVELMEDPLFSSLNAVQNKAVYGTPNAPFSWVDRPSGPNRIVGIRWLSGLLYPDYLSFDVDAEIKEFFRLFYHVELDNQQLKNVYQGIIQTKTGAD